jgi:hypothetical protein
MFIVETNYEFEEWAYPPDNYTPERHRRQTWASVVGGTSGNLTGNHYTWTHATGWQSNLDTVEVAQLQIETNFLKSLAWSTLAPDLAHALVTAGAGTYHTDTGTWGGILADNYAIAAKSADGTLGLVYDQAGNTLTVNMGAMTGTVTARWFDPSNGTSTAIAGSPFSGGSRVIATPGNTSDGQTDWVLLLQSNVAQPKPL